MSYSENMLSVNSKYKSRIFEMIFHEKKELLALYNAITVSYTHLDVYKRQVVKGGISSFKLYMTYDNRVDDETMYEILTRVKELGGIVGVHCENHGIIRCV